jgi:predicted dinucleotide-binding enzyme
VAILSIPLNKIPGVAALVADLPESTVVMDTSNYYPMRDERIDAIEKGQVESLWVSEQLGRPVVKAWNSIGSDSFARMGGASGTPERIALPVASDSDTDRKVGMALVKETGFDAYDAGALAESWRQQPGAPCYCTDLTLEQLPAALAAAERDRLPKRRDLSTAAIAERVGDGTTNPSAEYGVRLVRALFM